MAVSLIATTNLVGLSSQAQTKTEDTKSPPRIYYSVTKGQTLADGKPVTVSWGKIDYGDTFKNDPLAQAEYVQYQQINRWVPYIFWAGPVAGVTYLVTRVGSGSFSALTFTAAYLGPIVIASIIGGHAINHLQKAVNIYNGVPAEMAETSTEPTNLFANRDLKTFDTDKFTFSLVEFKF